MITFLCFCSLNRTLWWGALGISFLFLFLSVQHPSLAHAGPQCCWHSEGHCAGVSLTDGVCSAGVNTCCIWIIFVTGCTACGGGGGGGAGGWGGGGAGGGGKNDIGVIAWTGGAGGISCCCICWTMVGSRKGRQQSKSQPGAQVWGHVPGHVSNGAGRSMAGGGGGGGGGGEDGRDDGSGGLGVGADCFEFAEQHAGWHAGLQDCGHGEGHLRVWILVCRGSILLGQQLAGHAASHAFIQLPKHTGRTSGVSETALGVFMDNIGTGGDRGIICCCWSSCGTDGICGGGGGNGGRTGLAISLLKQQLSRHCGAHS